MLRLEVGMGWIVRVALLAGGALAALFVARDAENFSVVQGMMAVAVIAVLVLLAALLRRR
jgi:hypothetical protein